MNSIISRDTYALSFVKNSDILDVINLSDSDDKVISLIKDNYYFNLYRNQHVYCAGIDGFEYENYDWCSRLANSIAHIKDCNGKVYIHCIEGKDRTGFFCMILEGLAGASYEEIVDDYMLSYKSFYDISYEKEPDCYLALKTNTIDKYMCNVCSVDNVENISYIKKNCEKWLLKYGIDIQTIKSVENKIVS